jgi:hypothetical protein
VAGDELSEHMPGPNRETPSPTGRDQSKKKEARAPEHPDPAWTGPKAGDVKHGRLKAEC